MSYGPSDADLTTFQQYLRGTWCNRPLPGGNNGEGGEKNPLSFNVMPLPQEQAQPGAKDFPGYILKNFRYYETIVFNADNAVAAPAKAPNRGGEITQNSHALFYDQQVHFFDPPDHKGETVHIENGAWLYLDRVVQQPGPYHDPKTEKPVPPALGQPRDIAIAKHITVPHGNAVLALGSIDAINGSQAIEGRRCVGRPARRVGR